METFKLYSYFRSSASYRIRLALNFKGLPYDYIPVHLLKDGGQQHCPEYSQLNPMEQVPTLVHGDVTLNQSLPILLYLDDIHHEKPLLPKKTAERAQILNFCEIINSGIQPLQNLGTLQRLEVMFSALEEQKRNWMTFWIQKGLLTLEKTLQNQEGDYCFGDAFTAADAFLIPQVFASERFGIQMTDFPQLKKINDHCQTLEFVKASHPNNQPDTPQ